MKLLIITRQSKGLRMKRDFTLKRRGTQDRDPEQMFRVMAEMWGHEKAAEKFEELMIKEEQESEDESKS